jgi:hypothetical protein
MQSDGRLANTKMWTHDLAMNYKAQDIYEVKVREARRKRIQKQEVVNKRLQKLTYKILINGFR